MKFFLDFFRQEVPRAGRVMPSYYRKALRISGTVMAGYFFLVTLMIMIFTGKWEWVPTVAFVAMFTSQLDLDRVNVRINLLVYVLISAVWVAWYTCTLGWNTAGQHLLLPAFALVFFNIYEPSWCKLLYFVLLIAFRIALFVITLSHAPAYTLGLSSSVVMQLANSLVALITLALDFILFSSSIQERERQLLINNQELHKEAGTDPLTGLPNRRAILDVIERYRLENPEEQFSVAIADIDFFKKVNDTYGHHCGDYTLKELSALFMRCAEGKYKICRWGGEEFCFFLPGMNLDTAGREMHELNDAVRNMPINFNGVAFNITITVGVEENDFQSTLEVILDKADRKLYLGKVGGRDKVVF